MHKFSFAFLLTLWVISTKLFAAEIIIAVASNFSQTAQKIVAKFAENKQVNPIVVSGSSGNIFSQIKQGAPYDVFLSADTLRPEQLTSENLAFADSLVTYALGKLVLWSPKFPGISNLEVLRDKRIKHIAIANPKLAPYGLSTMSFIEKIGLKPSVASRLVFAENVSQAKHFVSSGNCEIGFISLAQVIHEDQKQHYWIIPSTHYEPIKQSAVVLKRSKHEKISRDFLKFIASPQSLKILSEDGYEAPVKKIGSGH